MKNPMVEFLNDDDQTFLVNVTQIILVVEGCDELVEIRARDSQYFFVKESYEQVLERINEVYQKD